MNKRYYKAIADRYDRRWENYTKTTLHKLIEYLPHALEGKKVLDFGCGTGELIRKLLKLRPELAQLTGYDPVEEMLWQARKKIEQLPDDQKEKVVLKNQEENRTKFDLLVSSSVLHYLPQPAEKLLHLKSFLKEGGTFLLLDYTKNSFPVKYFNWAVRLIDPMHQQAYYPRQIREMVEGAGFTIEREDKFRISFLWEGYVVRARRIK